MDHMSIPLPERVLCAKLGVNQYGNTLACSTQGDKAVHVYQFGNPARLALLKDPALSTAVSAIAMDEDHRRVVTGAESGSLRVFDVKTEQLIRTFSASSHRSAVTSIDYHPYGEFVVSASADCTAKVWDVRKKTCIQQYKGCPVGLTVVKCCPDGKVVVTGCEQGALRVYDLTMGKMRTQLANHSGAITSLCFHPNSMICASGGMDGAVNVVDFGTYENIFNVAGLRPSDSVIFTPRTLHGISQQSLSTWQCVDVPTDSGALKCSDAPWTRVADSAYSKATDELLLLDIAQNANAVMCCTVALGSSKKIVAPTSRTELSAVLPAAQRQAAHSPSALPPTKMHAQPSLVQVAQEQRGGGGQPDGGGVSPPPLSRPNLNDIRRQKKLEKAQQDGGALVMASPQAPQPQRGAPLVIPTPKPNPRKKVEKQQEPRQTVPDMAHRLGAGGGYELSGDEEEAAVLSSLSSKSTLLVTVLQRRLTQLKVVRSFWPNDVPRALNHILKLAQHEQGNPGQPTDQGTVVDFLTAMNQQRMKDKLTLETLPNLLSIILVCLNSPSPTETTVMTCLRLFRSVSMRFRNRIEDGIRAGKHAAVGVDLNLEARVERATKAYRSILEVTEQARQYVARKDALGEEARLLCEESF